MSPQALAFAEASAAAANKKRHDFRKLRDPKRSAEIRPGGGQKPLQHPFHPIIRRWPYGQGCERKAERTLRPPGGRVLPPRRRQLRQNRTPTHAGGWRRSGPISWVRAEVQRRSVSCRYRAVRWRFPKLRKLI